jgi:hypothetical protein
MRLPAFTGWGYSKDCRDLRGRHFGKDFGSWESEKVDIRKLTPRKRECKERPASNIQFPIDIMLQQFTAELTAVHGHVHQTKTQRNPLFEFLLTKYQKFILSQMF